jgi:hypothetical protein
MPYAFTDHLQIEEVYPWMDLEDCIDEHWEAILAEWKPDSDDAETGTLAGD